MLAVPLATCCKRPIPQMLWIEHIRTNRDILGEADARHCQPPGAWRIVVHDLSPFDLNVDEPSVRHKCAYVLGTDLNRSETGRPLILKSFYSAPDCKKCSFLPRADRLATPRRSTSLACLSGGGGGEASNPPAGAGVSSSAWRFLRRLCLFNFRPAQIKECPHDDRNHWPRRVGWIGCEICLNLADKNCIR
jgi:hypothetical protein